ncbi:MAG: hypothetical protein AAFN30_01350, partial [Actinomycetota bacterium]
MRAGGTPVILVLMLGLVLAIVLGVTACTSAEAPADGAVDGSAAESLDEPPLNGPPPDCPAAHGPMPWLTFFGGMDDACLIVGDDQDLQVWNKGVESMRVTWRGGRHEVDSDEHIDTGPVGDVLAVGPNSFVGAPYGRAVVWRLPAAESPTAGLDRDGGRLGQIEIGMTLAEAASISGLDLAVDPDLAPGPQCWIAAVVGDPYSPSLWVVGDGSASSEIVAIDEGSA